MSSREFDVGGVRLRFRHRLAIFSQAIEVKGDGFPHIFLYLSLGITGRDATRKIGGVGGKTGSRFFDHDEIFLHGFNPACFKTLFNVPGARSSPGLPGSVTNPGLTGCLYLSVTSPGSHKIPAVLLGQANDIANLHNETIIAASIGVN